MGSWKRQDEGASWRVSQRAVSFRSVSQRSEGGELQPVKLRGDPSRYSPLTLRVPLM